MVDEEERGNPGRAEIGVEISLLFLSLDALNARLGRSNPLRDQNYTLTLPVDGPIRQKPAGRNFAALDAEQRPGSYRGTHPEKR